MPQFCSGTGTGVFSNLDAPKSSGETPSKPQRRKVGVWGLRSVLCPESSCHTSTEHGLDSKSLPLCPLLMCSGLRLLRMPWSSLSTFGLEASLLKALSSLGKFSIFQVTIGDNYTKCFALQNMGHHFFHLL